MTTPSNQWLANNLDNIVECAKNSLLEHKSQYLRPMSYLLTNNEINILENHLPIKQIAQLHANNNELMLCITFK